MAKEQSRLVLNKSFLDKFADKVLSKHVVGQIQGYTRASIKRYLPKNKIAILFLVQDYGFGRLQLLEDTKEKPRYTPHDLNLRQRAEDIQRMIEFIVEEHIEAQLEEEDIADPRTDEEHQASSKLSRIITQKVYGEVLDPIFYE